jgi:hypothetical protein
MEKVFDSKRHKKTKMIMNKEQVLLSLNDSLSSHHFLADLRTKQKEINSYLNQNKLQMFLINKTIENAELMNKKGKIMTEIEKKKLKSDLDRLGSNNPRIRFRDFEALISPE